MGSGVPPKWKVYVDRRETHGPKSRWGMLATDATRAFAESCVRRAVQRECGQSDPVNDLMVEQVQPGTFGVPPALDCKR